VQYFTLPLVRFLGQGSDTRGWQMTMVLYGALAILLLIVCFATTRERVAPPPKQSTSLKLDLRGLFGSKPWLVLVAVLLLTLAAFAVKGSVSAYYFKYFLKREDLLKWFLLANGLAFISAVSIASPLARWIGKKSLFMMALGVGGLLVANRFQLHHRIQLSAGLGHVCGYGRPCRMAYRTAKYRTGICLGYLCHQDRLCCRRRDAWIDSHLLRICG
jgi:GPH family glycoside/pentoside/hexuronide:cation symporter